VRPHPRYRQRPGTDSRWRRGMQGGACLLPVHLKPCHMHTLQDQHVGSLFSSGTQVEACRGWIALTRKKRQVESMPFGNHNRSLLRQRPRACTDHKSANECRRNGRSGPHNKTASDLAERNGIMHACEWWPHCQSQHVMHVSWPSSV